MATLKVGRGPLSAPLWIIGDNPYKSECSSSSKITKILSSGTDQSLYNTLFSLGLAETDIHSDLLCYKPGRFENLKQEDVGHNLERIKQGIKECKPNLVLLHGKWPLEYLGEKKNVMNWRGHVFWNEELQCKMMGILSQAAVKRQQFVDKKDNPGQYKALFIHDMYRVLEEMKTPDVLQVELHPITKPTFVEAESVLEEMLKNAEILSYDIETLKPYGAGFIDCIGLASSLQHGICIPLYLPTRTGASRVYSEKETVRLWQLIKDLMESEIPKVAQNSIFDTGILEHRYGIKTNNLVWDTLVAAHNLYCDLPKDLGCLISLYTNLPYHKYLIHKGIENRWIYNAVDAIANLHIMQGEKVEAEELGILDHYRNHTHPCIKTSVKMHLQGVPVDEELRDKALVKEEAIMEQILMAFDKVLPFTLEKKKGTEHKFNPNSPPQKKELFLEILRCPAGKKTYGGKVSMDKHKMEGFAHSKNPVISTFAQACLEYKRASSMAGRLKTPTHNGRIFTQQNPAGTNTGRWNSKASEILPGGTNLQNLQKGLQRQMIRAPRGESLWGN